MTIEICPTCCYPTLDCWFCGPCVPVAEVHELQPTDRESSAGVAAEADAPVAADWKLPHAV